MKFKALILVVLTSIQAPAQWLNYPDPGVPRLPNGKVNLKAQVPRTRDGKPDLSGVWIHETTTVAEAKRLFGNMLDADITLAPPGMEIGTQHKYAFDILIDIKDKDTILRPEAKEALGRINSDPSNVCDGSLGIPIAGLLSELIKIVQTPKLIIMLYELDAQHRQIFTDGRALPREVNLPAYLGYSAGHWERETLVVETAGFNDKTLLDIAGHRHSEALHLTERFRRRDLGHMEIEMTFDDPKMFTHPFTIKVPYELVPDQDIFEMNCNDNEKDRIHLKN